MKKRPLKILTAGGGSGGHVTPISAVITELRTLSPGSRIYLWTDFKFYASAKKLIDSRSRGVKISRIFAGKFRRYSGFTAADYLKNPLIILLNFRDLFLIFLGFIQSFIKLIILRPDIIFLKGGYVCLPVGVVARMFNIPFVIHDSDTVPGLTNRFLSGYATRIATGMPLENYNYPESKARYTGIPTAQAFTPVGLKTRRELKTSLGFNSAKPLVFITGGGLGAKRINESAIHQLEHLLPITSIALVTGTEHFDEIKSSLDTTKHPDFKIFAFLSGNYVDHLQAADIVVARAGATAIIELANAAKPAIIIPNAQLPGRHQVKNADFLKRHNAAVIVPDELIANDPAALTRAVKKLLDDPERRSRLSSQIHTLARPDSATQVAQLVLDTIRR